MDGTREAPEPPDLAALVYELHNLVAERAHDSASFRVAAGPRVLACLKRIRDAAEAASDSPRDR
jgi:hypothetical protein